MSLIVQEAINDSSYDDDGNVICLNWNSGDATKGDFIRVAMFEHPENPPAELVVTYKPRRVYVVM